MVRIVEHRSALPNVPIVEVHVRPCATADPPVIASVNVNVFGQDPDPTAFPARMPVNDAFLHALAYASRVARRTELNASKRRIHPKCQIRQAGGRKNER